jgi:hypothetical protein
VVSKCRGMGRRKAKGGRRKMEDGRRKTDGGGRGLRQQVWRCAVCSAQCQAGSGRLGSARVSLAPEASVGSTCG